MLHICPTLLKMAKKILFNYFEIENQLDSYSDVCNSQNLRTWAATLKSPRLLVSCRWRYPVGSGRWSWSSPLRCSSLSTRQPFSLSQKPPPLLSASLSKGKVCVITPVSSILCGPDGFCSSSSRTQSCESDYLSAGSRVLSAAGIPRPKLTVHYTTVNSSQEQVFTLDVSSARRWLQHNHLWANEIWTLWTRQKTFQTAKLSASTKYRKNHRWNQDRTINVSVGSN